MGDFNELSEDKIIQNICRKFGLKIHDGYLGGSRGPNKLDFFLTRDVKVDNIEKGPKVGTSDHNLVYADCQTGKSMRRRTLDTFPLSAINQKFRDIGLNDHDSQNGYEEISDIL